MIANAQAAVVKLIKDTYDIMLSSSSFLTVSFTPSTASADSDLDTLRAADAITSNGQLSASLTAAMSGGAAATADLPSGASGAAATGGSTGT